MDTLYYSHNGKGPGVARIISISNAGVHLKIKSNEKAKRWSDVVLTKLAFDRSGWKMRGFQTGDV